MPKRGDQRMFLSGSFEVLSFRGLLFSSRNVSVSTSGFANPVAPKNGASMRKPYVMLRLSLSFH